MTTTAAARLPFPRLPGGYELLAPLGHGTTATVYRARQRSLGREVAVKLVPLPAGADASGQRARLAAQFADEMRCCAALAHPHIVPLLDAGVADDVCFAVFELVAGTTLRERLEQGGALAPAEAIRLMAQVLDALGHAHARGIVHRDVKPENVMLTAGGLCTSARVLDFGMAAFVAPGAGAAAATGDATLSGTPRYAAPEQLRGDAAEPRSDLYAWGLVLLECLSGSPPVRAESGADAVMRRLATGSIPIPVVLHDDPLRELLVHVTAPALERRPADAAAVLDALAAIHPGLAGSCASRPTAPATPRERRHLTVLSCRITARVPAGEASPDADADAVEIVLHARCRSVAEVAARHGGRPAGRLGNRVQIVFGYPHAREHDARLAVHAALDVVQAARAADGSGPPVEVAVGVHSGIVLVPDASALLPSSAFGLLGTTPEAAARLDALAGPGEVLVSDDTHRLLRGAARGDPVGERDLGLAGGRQLVHRVHGMRAQAAGREATVPARETALVARDGQLAALVDGWNDVAGGPPGAVLLTGEPGIGKSRLVRELRRRVAADSWLEARCLPESQDSPLRPIADLLATCLPDPLDATLARHGVDPGEHAALLAAVLDRPADPGRPAPPASPERRRELTLTALSGVLLGMARERPVALVVEDLHWADPTTLALLERLLGAVVDGRARAAGARLFVVCTARPGFEPPWPPGATVPVPLPRLAPADVEAVVRGAAGADVSPDVLAEVVLRADGIPLFAEEMARVLAAGGDDHPEVAVPATLRDLLTARLDALSPGARETAQLAATLGREFRYEVLRAVTPAPDDALRLDLRELLHAGLVHERGRARLDSFAFKHALVRDVAYDAMTRTARTDAHATVAAALQRCFPDVVHDRPEVLAHHLERADRGAEAAVWWKRSGDRTMARGAYVESIRHFTRGLALVEHADTRPSLAGLELGLLESLGTAQLSTEGYASPAVEATFARVQATCDALGEEVPLRALHGIWGVHVSRGDRAGAAAILPRFHRIAERTPEPVALLTAHAHTGLYAFLRGDFRRARSELEASLPWYRTEAYRAFLADYGYDGGLYAFAYLMWTLGILGDRGRALAVRDEMLAIARANANPYGVAIALGFGANLAHDLGDVAGARDFAERAVAHATEQQLYLWLGPATCMRGWALVQEGSRDDGFAAIAHGLALFQLVGLRTTHPYHLGLAADAHLACGAPEAGLAAIGEALELTQRFLDRFYEAELHRLRGELLAAAGHEADARDALGIAVRLAERQGAAAFAARATASLARLTGGGAVPTLGMRASGGSGEPGVPAPGDEPGAPPAGGEEARVDPEGAAR